MASIHQSPEERHALMIKQANSKKKVEERKLKVIKTNALKKLNTNTWIANNIVPSSRTFTMLDSKVKSVYGVKSFTFLTEGNVLYHSPCVPLSGKRLHKKKVTAFIDESGISAKHFNGLVESIGDIDGAAMFLQNLNTVVTNHCFIPRDQYIALCQYSEKLNTEYTKVSSGKVTVLCNAYDEHYVYWLSEWIKHVEFIMSSCKVSKKVKIEDLTTNEPPTKKVKIEDLTTDEPPTKKVKIEDLTTDEPPSLEHIFGEDV